MLLSSASGLMIGHTHAISGVLGMYKNESSSGVCRVSAEVAIIWFFWVFGVTTSKRAERKLNTTEGCSIKQVFVLDLIKVFVLDLNFLAKINKDFN